MKLKLPRIFRRVPSSTPCRIRYFYIFLHTKIWFLSAIIISSQLFFLAPSTAIAVNCDTDCRKKCCTTNKIFGKEVTTCVPGCEGPCNTIKAADCVVRNKPVPVPIPTASPVRPASVDKEIEKQEEKLNAWVNEVAVDPIREQVLTPVGEWAEAELDFAYKKAVVPLELGSSAASAVIGDTSWKEAFEEMESSGQAIAGRKGDAIGAASTAGGGVLNVTADIERSAGSALGGEFAQQVIEGVHVPTRFAAAAGITGGEYARIVLNGGDPKLLIGAPLARALRAAKEQMDANAKPIPAEVKSLLMGFYAPGVLEKARYTVGRVEIALPNLLNRLNQLFGSDHAVVVDDLIIFSREPYFDQLTSNSGELEWIAHEIFHIQQYQAWGGIEGFAYVYTNYPGPNGKVERQADAKGEQVKSSFFPAYKNKTSYSRLIRASRSFQGHPGYTCKQSGRTRYLTLETWENYNQAPCSVGYKYDNTRSDEKDVIWYAWNDYPSCVAALDEMLKKQTGWGWQCRFEESINEK